MIEYGYLHELMSIRDSFIRRIIEQETKDIESHRPLYYNSYGDHCSHHEQINFQSGETSCDRTVNVGAKQHIVQTMKRIKYNRNVDGQ